MSTVAEIREAISKLSPEDQSLLAAEIFATIPLPHESDPEFLARLDRSLAECDVDNVHSIEEVDAMVSQWTTKSPSPKAW